VCGFADDETKARLEDLAREYGLEFSAHNTWTGEHQGPSSFTSTTSDGVTYTDFGAPQPADSVIDQHEGYGMCQPWVKTALLRAWQVVLCDTDPASNRLWEALGRFSGRAPAAPGPEPARPQLPDGEAWSDPVQAATADRSAVPDPAGSLTHLVAVVQAVARAAADVALQLEAAGVRGNVVAALAAVVEATEAALRAAEQAERTFNEGSNDG
jgi:hypothetical protein